MNNLSINLTNCLSTTYKRPVDHPIHLPVISNKPVQQSHTVQLQILLLLVLPLLSLCVIICFPHPHLYQVVLTAQHYVIFYYVSFLHRLFPEMVLFTVIQILNQRLHGACNRSTGKIGIFLLHCLHVCNVI